jgi:hypothetical protein
VNGYTTGIDGSHTGWRDHCHLFGTVFPDVFQKSRLTCTRLSRKKYMPGSMIHEVGSQEKGGIGAVDLLHFLCIHKVTANRLETLFEKT